MVVNARSEVVSTVERCSLSVAHRALSHMCTPCGETFPCRFTPKPMVAMCVEDILKARGVKPVLSPNLDVLATVEALQVKKLLFIGVGCQVCDQKE